MRIVIVSAFYSEGMGYTENCLPKSLAALGHDVHVIASNLNVYGNSADYGRTYQAFLGPADQGAKRISIDGYIVHRLQSRNIAGYIYIESLTAKVREIAPDVVHCTEIASLQSFVLAAAKPFLGFKYFAETHQHLSVIKPFLRQPNGFLVKRAIYWLTRTLPTFLASLAVEKCYAIAPDCVDVATRFYGVPADKTKLQSLGTDTDLFRPAASTDELALRRKMRAELGYAESDVVCIYTGRFSKDKNPLVLAQAIDRLCAQQPNFRGLFIGEGPQKDEILHCRSTQVLPFAKHTQLADLYRIADVAIWPRQESMSMLDAAACELPLIVSDQIGENERVAGNGRTYIENSADDLARVILSLSDDLERKSLGAKGRTKMIANFSWSSIAKSIVRDYVGG